MASFEELQALAAARSKASQDRLAAERAKREAIEREKKLALENKARQDIQKERESLVAREQKRKRDEEQKKQMEIERKKLIEKRERERKDREKYGMDVVKFRNATEKAISNAGGSAKLKKKLRAKDREGQDSVSPPPNLREYSTLTREEKRKKKEAAMLGLINTAKRKAPTNSSHHLQKKESILPGNGLVPLGTHKRDTRSVDQIERDLAVSRQAKLSMQGNDSQKGRLLEEERRGHELESMLRRTKAMQERRWMEDHGHTSMTRSSSDSSDEVKEKSRASNGNAKNTSVSIGTMPKIKPDKVNSKLSSLNPADYLPGAPIKASMIQKTSTKQQSATRPSLKNETSKATAQEVGPSKKETPRDIFIRQEAERKKQLEKREGLQKRRAGEDEDEEESESSADEGESESEGEYSDESEEEDISRLKKRSKVSEEIWSLFNHRDKSEYLARDIDSDDDMEVDMESLRREEARSARIARLEDQKEEEAQRRREQEKAQRKKASAVKAVKARR